MENIKIYIDYVTSIIEAIGVLTIFIGLLYSLIVFIISLFKSTLNRFGNLRQTLGKSILLGLEILIAADIITTVSTEPSLESVTVLGLIVLIRTFLSMSLQVELEGKFPWQKTRPVN
ncbi:MAG: DUF1622 domain-containing protein [Bacteroidales bacterium]